MADYLSKKVKKKFGAGISSSRWNYLSLEQAEPDLGNPLVGPSSVGARPYPSGSAYILASFAQTDRQDRYWVPPSALSGLGLGLIPGAFTIRDEGATVGAASSFTTLNFVGQNVSVDYVGPNLDEQTGVATVRIRNAGQGIINSVQYHNPSGLTEGASTFVYNVSSGRVGIGTTQPVVTLDLKGSFSVSGITTATTINAHVLNAGSAFLSTSLYVAGIEMLSSSRQLKNIASLDETTTAVIEQAIANAPNNFTSLNISGVSTFNGALDANAGGDLTGGFKVDSLVGTGISIGIATVSTLDVALGDFDNLTVGILTATTAHIDVGTVYTLLNTDIVSSGITTTNVFKAKYAQVSTAATISNLFATHADITGLTSTGRFWAGVAAIGSTITATNIGINTEPDYPLDVVGNVRFGDKIYVSNGPGVTGQVLLSQGGTNPPVWGAPTNVTVGAAQSVYIEDVVDDVEHFLTFTTEFNDTGYIKVDTGALFYNPAQNRLGIGSTANFTLDVLGDINFTGTLFQDGVLGVFSRWTIDEVSQDIFRFDGNIGIGTSALTEKFTVLGDTLLEGSTTIKGEIANGLTVTGIATIDNFTSALSEIQILQVGTAGTIMTNDLKGHVGIGTTISNSTLKVTGDTRLDGITHFEGTITERIDRTFGSNIPSTNGKMTIDVNAGTVVVGVLTESVGEWAFVGVNTETAKATTVTLIIDSDSLLGYAETCSINGGSQFGVRWGGGIAPLPTNNEDIISFTIASDATGSIRVYGSSSLNFS